MYVTPVFVEQRVNAWDLEHNQDVVIKRSDKPI